MADNLGPTLKGVMFSLTPLSTIIVGLRIYCRAAIIKKVTWDDFLIIFALIQAWALVVTNYFHVYYGTGTHSAEITDYMKIIIPTLKLWYAYQLQYHALLYFVKMSILCFYWRLSPNKSYRWTIYTLIGIITAYSVAMFFVNLFECPKDISKAWSVTFPEGCNDLVVVYYSMAAFNIATDLAIFLLPLPVVMNLQVNKRKRTALLLVFSVGSLAVIASIVRINALYKYQQAAATGGDIPYVAAYILIWSQVEVNMAISSASAPALKPLLKSALGETIRKGSSYYGHSSNNGGVYGSNKRSGNHDIRLGKYKGHIAAGSAKGSASTSQENIIGGGNGILRTTDVKVDVEAKNNSEESLRRLEFR